MTDTVHRERPEEHDAWAGQPVPEGGERALPTPSTPGYTTFTDYRGRKWTCCVCVKEFLTLAQRLALKRGLLKQGFDVWQLTGGATASAGTHSQGGAFDLLYQTSDAWVKFFRDLGATATWRRTTAQGFSATHLHGVLNGCPHNSPARYQVTEQKSGPPTGGGDGLTGTKPDYHPDPNPYRTWSAGVLAMKKELGDLALATTTSLTLAPPEFSKGAWAQTSARTQQPGTSYAAGTHVYEYLPAGTTTWKAFKSLPVVNGVSSFFWNYGGPQPIRVRFVPKDATVSKASTSGQVVPKVVDVAAMRAAVASLTDENTTLKAEIERLKANPPKPVPAYGVDVSGWQTPEQVQALVADPVNEFVIVKATQRANYTSTGWPSLKDVAGDKFLGSYHYAEPPRDPVAEADWYLSRVGALPGVLAYDIEAFGTLTDGGVWVERDVRTTPLTDAEKRVLAVTTLTFLRHILEVDGRRPLVYTNWLWLKPLRDGCTVAEWEELVTGWPLWLAQVRPPGQHDTVSPKPGSSKGWDNVLVHQYAYTPLGTNEIDRDWTPDIARLRALATK